MKEKSMGISCLSFQIKKKKKNPKSSTKSQGLKKIQIKAQFPPQKASKLSPVYYIPTVEKCLILYTFVSEQTVNLTSDLCLSAHATVVLLDNSE